MHPEPFRNLGQKPLRPPHLAHPSGWDDLAGINGSTYLAYYLYGGRLKSLVRGQPLFPDAQGQPVAWQAVEANTAGRFPNAALANGYLYLTFTSDKEQTAVLNVSGPNMILFSG